MKERNFKFRKSYAEVIRVMDDKQAGRFIKAVSDYVFDGRAYDGNDTAIKSAFTLVKVSLDGDKADRENAAVSRAASFARQRKNSRALQR